MPNCDWGKPCTCRECRTQFRKEICPICGFDNVVEIEGAGEMKTDRKGMRYADIIMPTGNNMNLDCFECGHVITNVGFFTRISVHTCESSINRNKLIKSSTPCDNCNENIQSSIDGCQAIELFEYGGSNLCKRCLSEQTKINNPDPSNQDKKYVFDEHELKWVPSKIRVACESCGKLRWLNIENSWKKQCLSCYKKA